MKKEIKKSTSIRMYPKDIKTILSLYDGIQQWVDDKVQGTKIDHELHIAIKKTRKLK